ncbi:MAG TPA: DNA polymerase IV [Bacillota bacterium]|jgi:DNA polymerase-4|nr:DNA polymerase IV [Bacillota bacterium]HOB87387.1 DNA polymerase IV [Bacillota bacterium]HPU02114.1 DNA polymerase IV [Bacillota bacterium]
MAAERSVQQDILLCDLDAFFASVEQRDNPHLRGLPVIVGGSPATRGVVSTCSYEARRFGVRSAMPTARALQLCPGAVLLPCDMERYRRVSEQVFAIYSRFTPDIEIVSIDEAYLGLPSGKGLAAAREIHRMVREELELPLTIGVSRNKLLAKIASEMAKPNRVGTLWPEDVPTLLWPRPVELLPGLGPVSVQKLKGIGIATIGQLAATPLDLLQKYFGSSALLIQRSARGIDERPLETVHRVKSISEEKTFPEDLADEEAIQAILMEQAESLGYRLRARGLLARTVTLKLRFADFSTITRDRTLPAPTDSDLEIYQTARELFALHKGRPPWRLVGVRVAGLGAGQQLALFDSSRSARKEEELALVRDRLREKYGDAVLHRARSLLKPRRKK